MKTEKVNFKCITIEQAGMLRAVLAKILTDETKRNSEISTSAQVVYNMITVDDIPVKTLYLHANHITKISNYLAGWINNFEKTLDLSLNASEVKDKLSEYQVMNESYAASLAIYDDVNDLYCDHKEIDEE